MKNHLLALLLLTAPAQAGNYLVTATETNIPLDTPPPGATSLEVHVSWWDNGFDYGVENLVGARCFSVDVQHAIVISAGATDILTDRMNATTQSPCFAAYDGTTNYAGASGASWTQYKSKGPTAWETYSGLPSALTLTRRTVMTTAADTAAYFANSSNALVEWEWQ